MTPRRSFAAAELRGGIIMCGGCNVTGSDRLGAVISLASSAEVFFPATNVLEALPRMRWPRVGHAAATFRGLLYVFGGLDPRAGHALSSVEVYDPSAGAWYECPSMAMTRPVYNHAATVLAGQVYIIGGFRQNRPGSPAESSVQRMDLAASAWETLEPMESGRAAFCVGVVALGPMSAV
eukprot:UN0553